MKFTTLKGQCLLWLWTLMGFVVLLVVGFMVALWMGEGHQTVQQKFNQLPWALWRGFGYGVLLLSWPHLVRLVINYRQSTCREQSVSRRPLIILIVLYELLLVQDPLAALFRWVG
ncbi:hypothetical protein NYF23_04070 [SAR92 clade bacterium H455]|jgi:hypothetical protein|uniref:Uncharacterized protein n=1 Tax=SAR92 clade bacterium H455 TaxID=2974818 RepID=A0ABY5TPY7_9GAMM|nr:hypothetical protein NYF23_04070 [SAR92 clade bacterium H455]